jgi:hypothetical protein
VVRIRVRASAWGISSGVERLPCTQEAEGSIPSFSTYFIIITPNTHNYDNRIFKPVVSLSLAISRQFGLVAMTPSSHGGGHGFNPRN